MLFDMLQLYAEHSFEGIPTGDELWFLYTAYGKLVFATLAREAVPRTKENISTKKTMVRMFFTSARLLMLTFLPKGRKFNQEYFTDMVLPNRYSEKRKETFQLSSNPKSPSCLFHISGLAE
jgi:hypothetical protein